MSGWEVGTGFPGLITDGNHIIPVLIGQGVYGLSKVMGDVYADFLHGSNGERMESGGVSPSAKSLGMTMEIVAEETFSHLAAGAIVGAQDEDAGLTTRHRVRRR